MDREHHVCPACGQSVDTVVRRHKTLGAWVPRWVAGPCHNAECEAYVEPGTEQHGHHQQQHGHHQQQHGHHLEQHGRPEPVEEGETPAAPTS